MLCYGMLCGFCYAVFAMPCYAMLCYAMLCYAMLCDAMLCYAMLWDEVDAVRPHGGWQSRCRAQRWNSDGSDPNILLASAATTCTQLPTRPFPVPCCSRVWLPAGVGNDSLAIMIAGAAAAYLIDIMGGASEDTPCDACRRVGAGSRHVRLRAARLGRRPP
jgi:hypothetical protein